MTLNVIMYYQKKNSLLQALLNCYFFYISAREAAIGLEYSSAKKSRRETQWLPFLNSLPLQYFKP